MFILLEQFVLNFFSVLQVIMALNQTSHANSDVSQPEALVIPDNEIFPSAQYSKQSVNNQYVDFTNLKKSVEKTLIGVLQEHPIAHALTVHADVPLVYLQQFWHSLHYETREAGGVLVGNIERHVVTFNLGFLRHLLQLPVEEEFAESLPTEVLLEDLLVMGYTDRTINMISKFTRKHLTGIWYNLFGVLAKSLCPSGSGLDKATTNFMIMFHGFCFGRRIDYALCIWNELKESVVRHTGAKAKLFIPYSRFLAVIINNFLERFPAINKRRSSPQFKASVIKFQVKKALAEGERQMIIPLALLKMARGNPSVEDYIAEHYPDHVVEAQESSADTNEDESESTKSEKEDDSDDESDNGDDDGAENVQVLQPSPKRRKIIVDESDRADDFFNLEDYELGVDVAEIAKSYADEEEDDSNDKSGKSAEGSQAIDEHAESSDSLEVYDSYDEKQIDKAEAEVAINEKVEVEMEDAESDKNAELKLHKYGNVIIDVSQSRNAHIRFDSDEEEEESKSDDVIEIEDDEDSVDKQIPSPKPSVPSTSGHAEDINWDIRQMHTNDIKLVLFLRLKSDLNVTREDATLANLIAEQNRFTESQWKSDLKNALHEFEQRQNEKFEAFKDGLGHVMEDVLDRLARIEETCKAAASKDKQRKDDDDHEDDPQVDEGENKKDAATAGPSSLDQPISKDKEKASDIHYERRKKHKEKQTPMSSQVYLTKEEEQKVLADVFGESSEEVQEVIIEERAQAEIVIDQVPQADVLVREDVDRTILAQVFDRLKQQAAYFEQERLQAQNLPRIDYTYTEEDRQKLLEEHKRINEAFDELVKEKKAEKKKKKDYVKRKMPEVEVEVKEEDESTVDMNYIPPVDHTWSLEYHLQRLEEHKKMKAKEEEDERIKKEEEERMIGFRPWGQSTKASKPKQKTFVKAKLDELILDACKKIGRFRFTNNAYMEDNFKEMFVNKPKVLSVYKLNSIEDWPRAKKLKWKNALSEARQPDSQIRSRHKIVSLVKASKLHCQNYTLYQVEVTRDDGNFYMLSEADFPHMDLKDIDRLYELLREIPVNSGPYQNLRTAVRRFMKFKINDMCCHDFQMGMECSQPFLNLTPPLHHTIEPSAGTRMFEVDSIGRQLGIYYPSEDDSKRFLMLKDELNKFSDGTLKMININLAGQIVKVEFPNKDLKVYDSEVYHQQRVLEMQSAVRKRLSDRVHVREFEVYFGLRERQQSLD